MDTIALITEYQSLNLDQVIDYDKFNLYKITNHSIVIEGSTLTEIETQLLLDENLTPKGKPLEHSLMAKDHHKALLFVLDLAKNKKEVSVSTIQKINALVMANTGTIYNTPLAQVDATQGDLRKMNVFVGSRYFPNYDKVPGLIDDFCSKLNELILDADTLIKQLELSFWAHFNFVSIHPFVDGNGRTARLLMNYIQHYFNLPLSIVFKEDKAEYFEALEQSRKSEDLSHFISFMFDQYHSFLTQEVEKYKNRPKGFSFVF